MKKKRIEISIDWWNDDSDLTIPKENEQILTIEAITRITSLIIQGFTAGRLSVDHLYDSTYSGKWEIRTMEYE